jgi:hypothetical protein
MSEVVSFPDHSGNRELVAELISGGYLIYSQTNVTILMPLRMRSHG